MTLLTFRSINIAKIHSFCLDFCVVQLDFIAAFSPVSAPEGTPNSEVTIASLPCSIFKQSDMGHMP